MKHNTARLLSPILILSLFCAFPAAAQQPPDSPAFGEIVDVRVINLEVVVTDGGERVAGLASDDFRLLVDGREVPIEYFTEVRDGFASTAAARESTAAVPALEPGEAVGTRYLVFIDETFLIPAHRNRVLRSLVAQLPLLGPDDHMAVVAFDGRRIDLLSSWTRSLPELERVFEEARSRTAYGLHNMVRRIDLVDTYYWETAGGRFPFVDRGLGGPYLAAPRGSRSAMLADRVVHAATSTLRAFAKPPGRKVMLLLSGGWPNASFEAFSSLFAYGAADSHRRFAPLIDTANRLGYTLYPIDVKGLESGFGGAEYGTLGEARLAADLEREREWIEEGAFVHLARETGGRAHLDGASSNALRRTIDDTRSYYWLGFTPTWRENDERHGVKVEVLRKGLKVRSRKSFWDLSRQTEVTMLVESSQLFDLPMPGETADLGVELGEPEKGGFHRMIVPLTLEIPLDQVTVLPAEDGWIAQLELRIGATDDRGDRADIPVIPVELALDQSPAAGDTAVYELGLKLRRRPHHLLVSLHDPASGAILSQRLDLSL